MLSQDELRGIFLSHPTAEINISKDVNTNVGYRVRLRVSIHRSLLQYEINSKIKKLESNKRPRPILYITGLSNLETMYETFSLHSNTSNVNWNPFAQVMWMVRQEQHLTQDGLDNILRIKDLLQ
jgi:hypothetical protein